MLAVVACCLFTLLTFSSLSLSLCVYASFFSLFGCVIAAERNTLPFTTMFMHHHGMTHKSRQHNREEKEKKRSNDNNKLLVSHFKFC